MATQNLVRVTVDLRGYGPRDVLVKADAPNIKRAADTLAKSLVRKRLGLATNVTILTESIKVHDETHFPFAYPLDTAESIKVHA